MKSAPSLGVFKFASCDGCQLSLLDCEDELLAVAQAVRIANFPEASRAVVEGPYDVALVEGSITTAHDLERLRRVRQESRVLVSIGACATAGGIQALRNFADVAEYARAVYAHPEYISTLARSTPIAEHVPVDYELRGCPVNKHQLLEVLLALLHGRRPNIHPHPVCVECKSSGTTCVMVAQGTPCLGPVTHAGCGALCPKYGRGCFGCYGPAEGARVAALAGPLAAVGATGPEVKRLYATFNVAAPAFQAGGRGGEDERAADHPGDYLARVEGEGALTLVMRGEEVEEVRLSIFEPPRFFEGFLRGRSFREAPDITARICGICPVAYQMSSCAAMEDALGWMVPEELQVLRRLLYCGEWIESHALHMFMLHAPDFVGAQDVVALAQRFPEQVKAGLHIKKTGNTLMQVLGGREIHPINVRVGGFYRAPRREELTALLPDLEAARAEAQAALPWLAGFSFPELERSWELVTLLDPREYPFCRGRLTSSAGIDAPVGAFPELFEERHVARSNALHAVVRARGHYHTGPMARFNLCYAQLSDVAKAAAAQVGLTVPCFNPFRSLLVRGVELIQALDEAVRIVEAYRRPPESFVEGPIHGGTGHGASEAPRGLLYHRYTLDEAGLITDATIVPPTAQNQGTIEDDLVALAPQLAALPLPEATWRAEQAVRNYDPCISCATHFLTLKVEAAP